MQVENAKLQRMVAKKSVETTTNKLNWHKQFMSKLFFNKNKEQQV
jgi:hypothetical protein